MSSVFAQLNQGESVTKGLRHVDKSEMTHKNPELRTAGVVPTSCECPTCFPLLHLKCRRSPRDAVPQPSSAASSSAPQKPPKPSAMQKKPAKKELDGNKWNVVRDTLVVSRRV